MVSREILSTCPESGGGRYLNVWSSLWVRPNWRPGAPFRRNQLFFRRDVKKVSARQKAFEKKKKKKTFIEPTMSTFRMSYVLLIRVHIATLTLDWLDWGFCLLIKKENTKLIWHQIQVNTTNSCVRRLLTQPQARPDMYNVKGSKDHRPSVLMLFTQSSVAAHSSYIL